MRPYCEQVETQGIIAVLEKAGSGFNQLACRVGNILCGNTTVWQVPCKCSFLWLEVYVAFMNILQRWPALYVWRTAGRDQQKVGTIRRVMTTSAEAGFELATTTLARGSQVAAFPRVSTVSNWESDIALILTTNVVIAVCCHSSLKSRTFLLYTGLFVYIFLEPI